MKVALETLNHCRKGPFIKSLWWMEVDMLNFWSLKYNFVLQVQTQSWCFLCVCFSFLFFLFKNAQNQPLLFWLKTIPPSLKWGRFNHRMLKHKFFFVLMCKRVGVFLFSKLLWQSYSSLLNNVIQMSFL